MAPIKGSNATDEKDAPEEIDSDIDDHSVTDEKEGVKSGPPPGALLVNLTCFGCRVSKVKCDKFFPCGRCTRLGVECVEQSRKIGVGGFAAAKRKALGITATKGTRRHGQKGKKKVEKSTKKGRRNKRRASKASVIKDDRDKEEEDQEYMLMMQRQAAATTAEDRRLRALSRTRDTTRAGAAASPKEEDAHKQSHVNGCQHLEERKQPPRKEAIKFVHPPHDKDSSIDSLRLSGPAGLKTANEIVRHTFFELNADGLLDNTRVLQILRSWGLVAVRHAHEGLANSVKTMATAVGFDGRTFLEGPGHKAPRGLPSPITESDIPPFLRELYVNGAPAMVHFMVRGESRFLCNSHWSKFFLPEETCNRFFLKSGVLPYDTFALGVSPEDREEFFQACSRLLFSAHGDTADMSKIVKSCYTGPDGMEHEVLALHRVRVEVADNGELLGLAMCVHPLPESKYLDPYGQLAPEQEQDLDDDFDLLDHLPGPHGHGIVLDDTEDGEGGNRAHPLSDDDVLEGRGRSQAGGGGEGVGQWLADHGSELDFLHLDRHGLSFLLAPDHKPPAHEPVNGHAAWGFGSQAPLPAQSGPAAAVGGPANHELAPPGCMGSSSGSSWVGLFNSHASEGLPYAASPRGVSMFPGLNTAPQSGFAHGLRGAYAASVGQHMAPMRGEYKGASDAMDWCSVYQPEALSGPGNGKSGGADSDRMDVAHGEQDVSNSGSRGSSLHCDEAGVDMMIAPPQHTLPLW